MRQTLRFIATISLAVGLMTGKAPAGVLQVNDLNQIVAPGNHSNGLFFLDMSFSIRLSASDALSNAQRKYADARFATPGEWDDLFAAAGIDYVGGLRASDAFSPGSSVRIASNDFDAGVLSSTLGYTSGGSSGTWIWSAADGDSSVASTRDFILIGSSFADIRQDPRLPPNLGAGWLIVSNSGTAIGSVPEPNSFAIFGIGALAIAGRRARRR